MFPLIDCHNHSNHSFDAEDTLSAMCLQAEKRHLYAFAITDHCELEGNNLDQCIAVIRSSVKEMEQFRADHPLQCQLLTGVEIGQALEHPQDGKIMAELFDYDVIVSSHHYSPSGQDYYYMDLSKSSDADIAASLQGYFELLIETVEKTPMDVLAHCTYPLRYIVGDYQRTVHMKNYDPLIEKLLASVIKKGIALEVNTSGLRQKIGEPLPNEEILQKYRDMGGTMITLGSDAHNVNDLSNGIEECTRLLYRLGFSHLTYFRNRQPVLLPLRP